jgi:hypothetical protein
VDGTIKRAPDLRDCRRRSEASAFPARRATSGETRAGHQYPMPHRLVRALVRPTRLASAGVCDGSPVGLTTAIPFESQSVMRRASLATVLAVAAVGSFVGGASSASSPGPPRYHSCGRTAVGSHVFPVYATQGAACALARSVARRCENSCAGTFPQVLPKGGVFVLPSAGRANPLGFDCWNVSGAYAAGLPPLGPTDKGWILCRRWTGEGLAIEQLVAFQAQAP